MILDIAVGAVMRTLVKIYRLVTIFCRLVDLEAFPLCSFHLLLLNELPLLELQVIKLFRKVSVLVGHGVIEVYPHRKQLHLILGLAHTAIIQYSLDDLDRFALTEYHCLWDIHRAAHVWTISGARKFLNKPTVILLLVDKVVAFLELYFPDFLNPLDFHFKAFLAYRAAVPLCLSDCFDLLIDFIVKILHLSVTNRLLRVKLLIFFLQLDQVFDAEQSEILLISMDDRIESFLFHNIGLLFANLTRAS